MGALVGLVGLCWASCGRLWAFWALLLGFLVGGFAGIVGVCGRLWVGALAGLAGLVGTCWRLVSQHLWVGAVAGLLLLGFAGAVAGILAGLGALLGLWVFWACGFLWALLLVGLWRPHAPTCAHMHLRSAARFFPLFPLLGLQPTITQKCIPLRCTQAQRLQRCGLTSCEQAGACRWQPCCTFARILALLGLWALLLGLRALGLAGLVGALCGRFCWACGALLTLNPNRLWVGALLWAFLLGLWALIDL